MANELGKLTCGQESEVGAMTVLPLWAQLGQISITVLLGFIVAYVAIRQWQTARTKLRLDLFDRRYDIYKRVSEQFSRLLYQDGNLVSGIVAMEIRRIRDEAQFLFDEDVTLFLLQVSKDASKHYQDWKNLPPIVDEEGAIDVKVSLEAERIVYETSGKLTKLFSPYLAMTDKR